MNVLVIAPTPYFSDRGCHIRILEQITALKKAGHNPVLYTYHLGRNEGDVKIYRSPNIPWYNKTSAGPSWHKLYIDILLLFTILRTAKRQSFDIIHAHLHEGAWIGKWLKHWLKIPLILDAQGSLVGEMNGHSFFRVPGLKKLFWWFESSIIRKSDHIFTSSQAAFKFISDNFPTSKAKLSMLGDAVSIQSFEVVQENEISALASSIGIQKDNPIVMYTGGLSKIKGIDLLLQAIPHVLTKYKNAQFVIVGYPEIERCKTIAADLGVTQAVHFVGRVNYFKLPLYLRLADIAVDPKPAGAGEASGKLLNYMAAGLPTVAFDSLNTQDMMADCGHLVQDESSTALADGINYLLDNPELSNQLGVKAKKRIIENFSWDARIKDAIKIYEQLSN